MKYDITLAIAGIILSLGIYFTEVHKEIAQESAFLLAHNERK